MTTICALRPATEATPRPPDRDCAYPTSHDDRQLALLRIDAILAMRPRVVLLGEENAGKTALANALLGETVLPEAAVANTRTLTILRQAAAPEIHAIFQGNRRRIVAGDIDGLASEGMQRLEIGLPLTGLAAFDIVDTPPLSDCGDCPDIALTQLDLPVWCTRATQAWKESERQLWQRLPRRLKNRAILAVTNADTLRDRHSVDRVHARLAAETAGLFSGIVFTGRAGSSETCDDDPRFGIATLQRAVEAVLAARSRRTLHVGERLRARILALQPRAPSPTLAPLTTARIVEPAVATVAAHGHSVH